MNMEEAVTMAMNDADLKAHMMEKHMDLMTKTPEEMKQMLMGMIKEEDANAAAM